MAFRLYIVPMLGTPGDRTDPPGPKYFDKPPVLLTSPADFSVVYYGQEPWCVVGANLSVSDDNTIVGQADGFALPFDLSQPLTSQQVTNVRNKLDAMHVPSSWVSTSLTWQQVVRDVLGLFLFFQRYTAIYSQATGTVPPRLFNGGVTMTTQFGALPPAVQDALIAAAASLGLSTAGLTATTQLRTIFRSLMTQFAAQQYNFNGTLI